MPENHRNKWFQCLKPWATVPDPEAVKTFYQAQSSFIPGHLQVWTVPIACWSLLLLALRFLAFNISGYRMFPI